MGLMISANGATETFSARIDRSGGPVWRVTYGGDMEEENKQADENTSTQTTRLKKRALVAGFLTALFFASVTFFFWQTFENNRRTILLSAAQITANAVAQQVNQIVTSNLAVLESFADNWQDGAPEDERAYLSIATPLQSRFPALQAINWISPNYIILYVAPIKGNVPAIGADLKRTRLPVLCLISHLINAAPRSPRHLNFFRAGAVLLPIARSSGGMGKLSA
jgi:sensor domain CHASE-containing protein